MNNVYSVFLVPCFLIFFKYNLQNTLTHGVVSGCAEEKIHQNRKESHVYTNNWRNIAQNSVRHTYENNIDSRALNGNS